MLENFGVIKIGFKASNTDDGGCTIRQTSPETKPRPFLSFVLQHKDKR